MLKPPLDLGRGSAPCCSGYYRGVGGIVVGSSCLGISVHGTIKAQWTILEDVQTFTSEMGNRKTLRDTGDSLCCFWLKTSKLSPSLQVSWVFGM